MSWGRGGHATRTGEGWLTGTTVVPAPEGGAVAAVDVRGGGPGTKEIDALDPRNLVQKVEAIVLTGGSAYGLDAASGVMAWLEEQRRGVRVGGSGACRAGGARRLCLRPRPRRRLPGQAGRGHRTGRGRGERRGAGGLCGRRYGSHRGAGQGRDRH